MNIRKLAGALAATTIIGSGLVLGTGSAATAAASQCFSALYDNYTAYSMCSPSGRGSHRVWVTYQAPIGTATYTAYGPLMSPSATSWISVSGRILSYGVEQYP
ncbi:hypothetical protein [Sinosporangium siamense]|uniref:Uncharacterized protein n=1 Tax=Sinosporangium siamense TaxID=1367973 RepID=A0A919V7U9_9ACTN|nr:hypothetical protein [Sinosporangium siamense]GII93798.1 hypothetical protein Ssi02_40290 [Sinosporangium siamense]